MAEANATISKTINILIDSETIKKDIQMLFTFEDMGSDNFENVAWKVSNVNYQPGGAIQKVPIMFESTLAFSIASKINGKIITPGETIPMNLKEIVNIVLDEDQLTFKNKTTGTDKEIADNQIITRNDAGKKAGVSVGFLKGRVFSSAAYIGDLGYKSKWIATYKPEMKLYIASDATTGQTISTILKTEVVFKWDMASVQVPDKSQWFLKREDSGEYTITPGTGGK